MRRTDLAVRVCLGRVNQKKPFCGHVMSEASQLFNDSVLLPTLHRHRQKESTLDIFQIKPTCLPRYSHSPFSYNHLGHACSLFIHNLGYAWSLFRPSLGPQQFTIINLHVKLLLQNPPTTGHLSASKFQPIFATRLCTPQKTQNSKLPTGLILAPKTRLDFGHSLARYKKNLAWLVLTGKQILFWRVFSISISPWVRSPNLILASRVFPSADEYKVSYGGP